MNEEDWLTFFEAAREIKRGLRMSPGAAQAKLRELCASGSVRSKKEPYSFVAGQPEGEGPPVLIEPSEWRQREIDVMTDSDGCKYLVDVSKIDLEHWLNSAIKSNVQKITKRGSRKLELGKQAIKHLWPDGVPDDLLNKQIQKLVSAYLKQRGSPDISSDTILRAAGRK